MSAYFDSPNVSYLTPVFQQEIPTRPIEGTEDIMWAETYIQNVASYYPLSLSTTSSRHATCILVDESTPERVGPENSPLVRFTRFFASVPTIRYESVLLAQTYYGLSGGNGISWSPYGSRAPLSHYVRATDTISYYVTADPRTITLSALTQPTVTAGAVDYFGTVYSTVTPYTFEGFTNPASEPGTYVISSEVSRWKGQIWASRTRTVPWLPGII